MIVEMAAGKVRGPPAPIRGVRFEVISGDQDGR